MSPEILNPESNNLFQVGTLNPETFESEGCCRVNCGILFLVVAQVTQGSLGLKIC